MNVNVSSDCGNAPKKEFLKNLTIAFAKMDIAFLKNSVSHDIIWDKIGCNKIEGIESFSDELDKTPDKKIIELVLDQILTHGREGAVSGTRIFESGKQIAFSDFYSFSGAKGVKVRLIRSFTIQL